MESASLSKPTPNKSKSAPLSWLVLKLMEAENRPHGLNYICEKIGRNHDRQQVQDCLNFHIYKGAIIEKIYNKQKIYCVNNKLKLEAKNDLQTTEEMIKNCEKSVQKIEERMKVVEGQLKAYTNEVPIEILQAQYDTLVKSVNKLQSQADALNQTIAGETIDPKEFSKLQLQRDKYLQEFHRRKRMCMNLINAILEGYPKSKQKLIADTEIETDEAAGFNIDQYK